MRYPQELFSRKEAVSILTRRNPSVNLVTIDKTVKRLWPKDRKRKEETSLDGAARILGVKEYWVFDDILTEDLDAIERAIRK